MTSETEVELRVRLGDAEASRVISDCGRLGRLLSAQAVRAAYVSRVLQGEPGSIPELFAIARVSSKATAVEPHAIGRRQRRCDARVLFNGLRIYVEVKHQRDRFPFARDGNEITPGLVGYSGSRPGADTRYLGEGPGVTSEPLPGSTLWRGAIEEAAAQLPEAEPGLIMVSCDAFLGVEDDAWAALFGDPIVVARPDPRGWGSIAEERRLGNGVFRDPRMRHVAGVWFFRLRTLTGLEDCGGLLLCDWAQGALNPAYAGSPLPDDLTYSLPNVISASHEL